MIDNGESDFSNFWLRNEWHRWCPNSVDEHCIVRDVRCIGSFYHLCPDSSKVTDKTRSTEVEE